MKINKNLWERDHLLIFKNKSNQKNPPIFLMTNERTELTTLLVHILFLSQEFRNRHSSLTADKPLDANNYNTVSPLANFEHLWSSSHKLSKQLFIGK